MACCDSAKKPALPLVQRIGYWVIYRVSFWVIYTVILATILPQRLRIGRFWWSASSFLFHSVPIIARPLRAFDEPDHECPDHWRAGDQAQKKHSIGTVLTGEPVLDGALAGIRQLHHLFDGTVRFAVLSLQQLSDGFGIGLSSR